MDLGVTTAAGVFVSEEYAFPRERGPLRTGRRLELGESRALNAQRLLKDPTSCTRLQGIPGTLTLGLYCYHIKCS